VEAFAGVTSGVKEETDRVLEALEAREDSLAD
jgi:hypothetical protein